MRTVLQGNPGNPRLLLPGDLPGDHDLSFSFWRWLDFSGTDLSTYIMENMDIIDCVGRDVILPDGRRTDYLMTRRTDWTGAAIPLDVSSYIGDFLLETLRQRLPNLTGEPRQMAEVAIQVGQASYQNSWHNGIRAIMDRVTSARTLTGAEFLQNSLAMFGPYPRVLGRAAAHWARQDIGSSPPAVRHTRLRFRLRRRAYDLRPDVGPLLSVAQYDRWAAARMLETHLRQLHGQNDLHVYLGQLHPDPIVFSRVGDVADDWWKDSWPSGD